LIHAQASEAQMLAVAREHSSSLFAEGRQLVLEGHTSLDEWLRVTVRD
jgi:type II secretory ATPase GspE/PulE/Tfp pilus assembly ATPase PilB-like protein